MAGKLTTTATVDVMIPVLNEAHVLEQSVCTVRQFLGQNVPYRWRVVVVDNGSTDGTDTVARELSRRFDDVDFVHLSQPGRGRALRQSWMLSTADVVCYTDVDLSTELTGLPPLLHALIEDGYDLGTGSRLMRESKTSRSFKREMISRAYNLMVKMVLLTSFSDAQCGFKVATRRVVDEIVPLIEDQSWFFDTEMLVLAEKNGYRLKEVPIVWNEDDDSRVKIISTAWDDIKGVLRLRLALWKKVFLGSSSVSAKRRKEP